MRIAYSGEIFSFQRFGGVSRYFVEIAKELKNKQGIDVAIDAPFHVNSYLKQDSKQLGHRGWHLGYDIRWVTAAFMRQMRKRKRKQADQVRHATYFDYQFFDDGSLNVVTFYDMIQERFKPDPKLFELKQHAYERADHCIAISEATKADMIRFLNADPAKITVVHLASSISTQDSGTLPTMIADKPYVLWVGPRAGYKNFTTFVEAFSQTRARRNGCQVVCFGGPKLSPAELELLSNQGCQECFLHFVGDDQLLAAFYVNATVLAYVSRFEGFGIPPLEAMQCGCPVIAASAGSIPEIVGESALMVDPESASEIASAIENVFEQESLRSRLIAAGRARANQFSWSRCADETLQVYRNNWDK